MGAARFGSRGRQNGPAPPLPDVNRRNDEWKSVDDASALGDHSIFGS
jgi:hypothetical protein